MASARVLVCDDEPRLRDMLGILLRRAGHEAELVAGVREAKQRIAEVAPFDAVITDLVMPDGSGMDVLDAARRRDDRTQVLMITAHATTEQAVEAMRRGAYDYIEKPFRNDELRATLDKALEKRAIVEENRALKAELLGKKEGGDLVGRSPAIDRLRSLIERVADSPSSVLITGESGTGKELVARALHFGSSRRAGPFIVVNCGALPEALMESELFGHEKGAFTGAQRAQEGLFRAASAGTIFLDEIGDLPMPLQVKLLRVLQEKRVRPVGGQRELEVDVRVVAATNIDVERAVVEGSFRKDLFYRLNVLRLHIPPLRQRREDIPLLTEHFLRKHGLVHGKQLELTPNARRFIFEHELPGNVRELENLLERAATLSVDGQIELEDLTLSPAARSEQPGPAAPSTTRPSLGPGFDLDAHLGAIEKDLLFQALEAAGGVRTKAASLLGMTFRSFRYRIAKYEGDSVSED
ncbi:MAG: sigma-54-dependent Fis family transcriptional regulator [Polyangiaceae bacterium]|nr:sigma-54-dependent Fis family transcriptional regulator [Polyangiaceae bacterium]